MGLACQEHVALFLGSNDSASQGSLDYAEAIQSALSTTEKIIIY